MFKKINAFIIESKTLETIATWLFLGALVLIVLQQSNPYFTKLERDAGAYAYIGSQIAKGEPPYISVWESKPPGIFFINAIAILLGRGTRWGIFAMEFLFVFGSSLSGYHFIRKQFGLVQAIIASIFWLYSLNNVLAGGNFTEEYSLLFGFCALYLFYLSTKNKSLWLDVGLGITFGCTFLIRQNNAGVHIAILVTIFLIGIYTKTLQATFKRMFIIGLSAFIPILAISLYLLQQGAFDKFLEAAVFYNFFYAGNRTNLFSSFPSGIAWMGFSAGASLLGYTIAFFLLLDDIKNKRPLNSIILWLIIGGVIEVILSSLSNRNYEHYFINWLPVVACSVAVLTNQTLTPLIAWADKNSNKFIGVVLFVTVFFFGTVPITFANSIKPLLFDRSKKIEYVDLVAQFVNANTTPEQTVLVWGGQAGINFLSKREAPTSHLFYPLYPPSQISDKNSVEFYQDITTAPPELIVDGSVFDPNNLIPLSTTAPLKWLEEHNALIPPYLLDFLKYVQENYILLGTVTNVDIYQLKK